MTAGLTGQDEAQGSGAGRVAFISTETIDRVLTWEALIPALRAAYGHPPDEHESPPRTFARGQGASLRALASVPRGRRFMGAKVFGRGRNRGMNYLISLADQDTGEIRALLDANRITALRTAATSALFVACWTPEAPIALGVLGSGAEARAHVQAIAATRRITRLRVCSPTKANRDRFAQRFAETLGIPCESVDSAAAAAAGADVLVAAARSHDETPILHADGLRPGMVLVSVGSTLPTQREIDTSVIERCDVIVSDVPDELAAESGDMRAADAAQVALRHKLQPLQSLVRGELSTTRFRQPMFKSVGSALQDIVAAELVYELAMQTGRAMSLPITFTYKQ